MKERIQKLRKCLRLTQTEFAGKIGFQKSTVTGWEKSNPVPLNAVISICSVFNVRREWLETGVGEMFETPEPSEISALDFARSRGCGELTARIFEGYCGLSEEDKKTFEGVVAKILVDRRDLLDLAQKELSAGSDAAAPDSVSAGGEPSKVVVNNRADRSTNANFSVVVRQDSREK